MELSSIFYLLLAAFFGPKHIVKIWKKCHTVANQVHLDLFSLIFWLFSISVKINNQSIHGIYNMNGCANAGA